MLYVDFHRSIFSCGIALGTESELETGNARISKRYAASVKSKHAPLNEFAGFFRSS